MRRYFSKMEKCNNNSRILDDKKCRSLSYLGRFFLFIALIVCVCLLFGLFMKLQTDVHDLKITKEYEISANHMKEHAQIRDDVQILKMNLSIAERKHTSELLRLKTQLFKTLSQMNGTFQENIQDLKREVESTETALSNMMIKIQKQHSSDISKLEQNHIGNISQLEGKIRTILEMVHNLERHKNSQQTDLKNLKGRIENLEYNMRNTQYTLNSRNSAVTVQQNVRNLVPVVILVLHYFTH